MSSPDTRAALAALGAARTMIGRLDPSRRPEELAADLIAAWVSVEDALRMLIGGSAATGTELVRDARQRQLLTFEQANALAAFHAARERLRDAGYRPDAADLAAARAAIASLDGPLAPSATVDSPPVAPPLQPPAAAHFTPPPAMPSITTPPYQPRARRVGWRLILAVLFVAGLGAAAYYWFGGPRRAAVMNLAITEFDRGDTAAAAHDFRRALLIDPSYALPHVYLARMARDVGNLPLADEELQLAITADPTNALALREMGAYLFISHNYELARKFYVRAVAANPEDLVAQGDLGCTLIKLGRVDEGERWITRAGPGRWTTCVTGSAPPDPAP
ncbi:MAG: hypothetical protein B7Z72_05040 [Gemmatimonadetes bacterium 21-71-4]|nr:MAG: hypothetical protein B7Z72_05040 [Gemmatimonadetes bacterium 21-71-4]